MAGYVYILTNPSMPGLVKIGRSINGGESRARALYQTGVPTPFELAFEIYCANNEALEAIVHQRLDACRVNQAREFFRIDADACAAIVMGCYLSEFSRSNCVVAPADEAAAGVELSYLAHLCEVPRDELLDAVTFLPVSAVHEAIAANRKFHAVDGVEG